MILPGSFSQSITNPTLYRSNTNWVAASRKQEYKWLADITERGQESVCVITHDIGKTIFKMSGLREILVIGGTGAQGIPVVQGASSTLSLNFMLRRTLIIFLHCDSSSKQPIQCPCIYPKPKFYPRAGTSSTTQCSIDPGHTRQSIRPPCGLQRCLRRMGEYRRVHLRREE